MKVSIRTFSSKNNFFENMSRRIPQEQEQLDHCGGEIKNENEFISDKAILPKMLRI